MTQFETRVLEATLIRDFIDEILDKIHDAEIDHIYQEGHNNNIALYSNPLSVRIAENKEDSDSLSKVRTMKMDKLLEQLLVHHTAISQVAFIVPVPKNTINMITCSVTAEFDETLDMCVAKSYINTRLLKVIYLKDLSDSKDLRATVASMLKNIMESI
jgi:hypothetical protein